MTGYKITYEQCMAWASSRILILKNFVNFKNIFLLCSIFKGTCIQLLISFIPDSKSESTEDYIPDIPIMQGNVDCLTCLLNVELFCHCI